MISDDHPEWNDHLDAVEAALSEHADPRRKKPVPLLIPSDMPADPERWQWTVAALIERGWRIAVDTEAGLWFYAPGPLTDPGDIARNLN